MSPPRVEVRGVGLVEAGVGRAVVVEDELVRREVRSADSAADALGARAVIPRRGEVAATAPAARVGHVEREVGRQLRRRDVDEERADESLRLASGDHPAATRRDRHGAGAPQDLQLYRRALHARDTEGDAPIVDLVVAVVAQERVGDLSETEPLLSVDHQRHDRHVVQQNAAHLVGPHAV